MCSPTQSVTGRPDRWISWASWIPVADAPTTSTPPGAFKIEVEDDKEMGSEVRGGDGRVLTDETEEVVRAVLRERFPVLVQMERYGDRKHTRVVRISKTTMTIGRSAGQVPGALLPSTGRARGNDERCPAR